MGTTIAVVVGLLVGLLVVLGAGMLVRRRNAARRTASTRDLDASHSTIAQPAPMVGLESALDQVTDRAGRNMRQKLEDEAGIVDELRIQNDTGPLLRRALDRVEHTEPQQSSPSSSPSSPAATNDGPS